MNAIYIESGDLKTLEKELFALKLDQRTKSVLFLMADEGQYTDENLSPILQKFDKPMIGGIFPELIFQAKRKKTGIVLISLSFLLRTQLIDLTGSQDDFLQQLEQKQKNSTDTPSVLYVFADALSNNKESFIESLFNFFGINTTYIGGGAGSLKFEMFPCIIDNTGLHKDAAVIGWAHKKITLGVAHGWRSISDSMKVTKTHKNQIISINWKPAFEEYKKVVESHSGMKFTNENFFQIAKSYPLGIAKMNAEMVVRDPFMASGSTIHVVDIVAEGEYVNILHGNMDSLLAGAAKAKEIALSKNEENMDQESVFCIDCISRVLFMQENFDKELEAVGSNNKVYGILPIGEIANSGESYLEIYNKTIVVGLW